jgi:hypothetical protein
MEGDMTVKEIVLITVVAVVITWFLIRLIMWEADKRV